MTLGCTFQLRVRAMSNELEVPSDGFSLMVFETFNCFLLLYCTEKNLMECLVCNASRHAGLADTKRTNSSSCLASSSIYRFMALVLLLSLFLI